VKQQVAESKDTQLFFQHVGALGPYAPKEFNAGIEQRQGRHGNGYGCGDFSRPDGIVEATSVAETLQ
jgi:hypothetical protein